MKYAHFDNLTLERLTEALGKIRVDDDYAPYPWVELFDDYSGNVKKVSGSGMSDDIVFTFNNREELAKWVDDTLLRHDVYVMFFEALCFHDAHTLNKLADMLDSYNKRTDEQRAEIVRRVRKSASEGEGGDATE